MPAAPARAHGSSSSSRRWVWVAGAVVVALAAVWLVRSRGASAGTLNTSGNPRGRGESDAQEPSGGAAGIPDNLPQKLVTLKDELQQQVQQTDTTSNESPTSITPIYDPGGGLPPPPPPPPPYVYTPPGGDPPPGGTHPGLQM